MEYVQMTLNDWLEMKQSLERELSNLKTGFIRVGYCLRRIEEVRGYEQDGYKSIAEFAKAEYGLSASTVSRFMAINEKFSIDGYSERLDPKYMGFRQSIMGEMLGLPDQDLDLVTPQTSRQDVRELKQFNRQEPEKGVADDVRNLIENYFRENRDELNEIYNGRGTPVQEILNPSGNRVYRKGMYMMFFYTDCVKTKKFGGETTSYSWEDFRELIDGIFGSFASTDTYSSYFEGMSLEDEPEPTAEMEPEAAEAEEPEENIRPAAEIAQSATEIAQSATENAHSATKAEEAEGTVPEHPEAKEAAAEGPEEEEPEEISEGEAEAVAPAQIMPEPETGQQDKGETEEPKRSAEYLQALSDAGEKLDCIRKSYEDRAWQLMSEQLLALGFIVNQLKVMETV